MGIRSLKSASIAAGVKRSKFWDQSAVINNNSFESIATIQVGAGTASFINFTSIPSTYKHLQIRLLAQDARPVYPMTELNMEFNGDTSSNYSMSYMEGDGGSTIAGRNDTNYQWISVGQIGTTTGNSFGGAIVDIVDYANTSKFKSAKTFAGVDANGAIAGYGGRVGLGATSWRSTAAINSIKIYSPYYNLQQYSHFALYGIKG